MQTIIVLVAFVLAVRLVAQSDVSPNIATPVYGAGVLLALLVVDYTFLSIAIGSAIALLIGALAFRALARLEGVIWWIVLVVSMVFAEVPLIVAHTMDHFLEVDRCLDGGGSWDDDKDECTGAQVHGWATARQQGDSLSPNPLHGSVSRGTLSRWTHVGA